MMIRILTAISLVVVLASCRLADEPASAESVPAGTSTQEAPFPTITATALPTSTPSPSMPASSDTDRDGDGLSDEVELMIGLDPDDPEDAADDADKDGLVSAEEEAAATDSYDGDTDGGGENDGSEVRAGRDPLNRDDDEAPSLVMGATPIDGFQVDVIATTQDGTGRILIARATERAMSIVGGIPGTGGNLVDGPLEAADYHYTGLAVSESGATSAWWTFVEIHVAADVTPPQVRISVNGGQTPTDQREVSVEFIDGSEPVVEMRLATSEQDLAAAEWKLFARDTTFELPAVPGVHIVYAQVRDAAGLVSNSASGVVDYQP